MPFGARRLSSRIRDLKRYFTFTCLLSLCMGILAGCGGMSSDSQDDSRSQGSEIKPIDPRELARDTVAADGITLETPESLRSESALANDPLASVRPFEAAPGGSLGSLGLNLDTYFAGELKTDERLNRLERAVTAIQKDLRTMAPSIQRLVAIETDIQDLVAQLEILLEGDSVPVPPVAASSPLAAAVPPAGAAPAATTPAPEPGQPRQTSPPPPLTLAVAEPPPTIPAPTGPPPDTPPALLAAPAASPPATSQPPPAPPAPAPVPSPDPTTAQTVGGVSVLDIRIGEHPDKTRIVLDASASAVYTKALDNAGRVLVIEFTGANWKAAAEKSFTDSPLLGSYKTESLIGGTGVRLILQLKAPVITLFEGRLSAESGLGERIVIDLAAEPRKPN